MMTAQATLVASDTNSWVWRKVPPTIVLTTNRCTEFDFRVVGDGRSAIARYANNSNYRNDSLIRKESTYLNIKAE